MENNTHTFWELLPNKSKHIFIDHIKHYWHFEGVPPKQYYTLFQSLHQVILTFSELQPNNIDLFRAHIKQYSHFNRVITKQ